jgi:nucleotide-binding universal stress UspA family protein
VIEGALFHSGKPLLLVPEGQRATLKAKRVMIAWNSRIEASQAVARSLPLLAGAEDVRLVLVDPVEGEEDGGAEPGADMAVYLARHGAKVTVDLLPGQGRSVDSVLRQHAIDTAAELLVMGAYGHSRISEMILGGATRSVLMGMNCPVLFSH